jgi:DNA polymerase III sliding clamp (beta) subunit (PCNA family)
MQQGELQATDGLQTVGLRFIADDTPASDICTVTSVAPIYLAHLQTWLRSVAFALAKSDVRYYLRDVYITVGAKLGTVDVVASNGYVLAVHTVTSPALCALVRMRTEAGGMVNISHKVIKVIMAWKPTNHGDNAVVLSCSRASICFAFGDDTVCSASTDYIYYDYQRLLVQKLTHTNARIATDFAKTIASLAKTREVVEVTAQDDKLRVLCDGKELLACDATVGAEAHTVHLDSAYLYDALTAMKAVGFADAVVSISDTHCIHLSVGGFQFVQMGRRV